MRSVLLILLSLFSLHAVSHEYEPGQVWEYKARLKEPASTVTILKVEHYDDLGDVIHISLNDIKITNPLKGNLVTSIPHMPFTRSALDASVTKLKTKTAVPDFEQGYNAWKSAYEAGRASAFKITVKKALLGIITHANWVEEE